MGAEGRLKTKCNSCLWEIFYTTLLRPSFLTVLPCNNHYIITTSKVFLLLKPPGNYIGYCNFS